MRRDAAVLIVLVLLAAALLHPAGASADVSAYTIVSPASLLSGDQADGRLSDLMMENDSIAVVIGDLGHTIQYTMSGGNIIDAGSSVERVDALREQYTYFNDDWPRQAVYNSLQIIDDGSGGRARRVRATGVDSDNSSLAVVTDYILEEGDCYLTLSTTLTNNGGGTISGFEVGDAFTWGGCRKFAPGYGFDLGGTTTEPWLAGASVEASYGYLGAGGEMLWGPHGGGWSDVNILTVTLGPGDSETYERRFIVGGRDVASVATIIHQITGSPVGAVACTVANLSGGEPIQGAEIDAFDAGGDIYLQMVAGDDGEAFATLTTGDWRLVASAPGYHPEETWVAVTDGGSLASYFLLEPDTAILPIGDTLTVIQRPLLNIPAIVTPGDTLKIECDADPGTGGWSAGLVRGAIEITLPVIQSAYDPSTLWWTVSTVVPAPPIHELYDLVVGADGGIADTSWNAVRVIPEVKDEYYIVHVTDTHLPTHLYVDDPGSETDTSEIDDLRAIIEDIGLINPEFVLLTGDLVNEGELEDYLYRRCYTRAQKLLAEFEAPVYLTSGNHDIGGWDATPPPDGEARRTWWRFFGWKRLDDPPPGAPERTQNYSFDYGPVHYTALEAYDNYDMWRSEYYGSESFTNEQMSWLAADLTGATGSAAHVLFYHYDFQNEINLNSLGVEMALWGHIHSNSGNLNNPPYDIATNNVCDGERSYRLVRVSNGVLDPRPTLSAGSGGNNLTVEYDPANDGTHLSVTAEITNGLGERFEHGLLRFRMPSGAGSAAVTGGTLTQIDDSDPIAVYYVAVDIGPSGTQTVTIDMEATGVASGIAGEAPLPLALGQNHPNPFNPLTTFRYDLPEPGRIRLVVYDTRGREIAVLIDESRPAGSGNVAWDGRDGAGRAVPSGVYLARLDASGETRTRKVVLAR